MFIFPGLGLGVVASRATNVSDYLFYVAARRLADCVTDSDLDQGKVRLACCEGDAALTVPTTLQVFPPIHDIREVSQKIAVAVATAAQEDGLARSWPQDRDWCARERSKFSPLD